MFDTTVIRNARLPHRAGLYQISIEAGVVSAIAPADSSNDPGNSAAEVIDVAADWISLGAVDLQINGALGLAFPDLRLTELKRLREICRFLWNQGVDSFCPTIVTTSVENIHGSLAAIRAFQQPPCEADSAKILGVHLEGPFLNEAKRGAHPAEFLQPLTLATVKAVLGNFVDVVSIVTLAPEMETAGDVIPWLTEQGITVSLGHSLATAEQAKRAFDQGASMVTHAFNAMPGLHHRQPGLLGAALTDSRVACGFIADGQHICPTMLDLLLRSARGGPRAGVQGLFLVSDALSPLGLPDGTYPWDDREIEVVGGTARLADGTLSGTTLPLIAGAQNLVAWGLCGVEDAIALVTDRPREAIGQKGLAVGQPAQLLRWHQEGAEVSAHRLTSLLSTMLSTTD
ncbi:MAG: N-acetylglucosamine-6-phosphate deacetylase [Cyanobacteria bacterium J06606_4]